MLSRRAFFDLYQGGELPRVTHTAKPPRPPGTHWGWVVFALIVGIGSPVIVASLVYRHEEDKWPIPNSWKPRQLKETKKE